jgi:hypothetical protein
LYIVAGALEGVVIDLALQYALDECIDLRQTAWAAVFGAAGGGVAGAGANALKAARAAKAARSGRPSAGSASPAASPQPDPNRLHHIFDNPRHGLDKFVNDFGSQEAAFNALQNATQKVVESQGVQGVFKELSVQVGSRTLSVSGRVMDGVARIGTAHLP